MGAGIVKASVLTVRTFDNKVAKPEPESVITIKGSISKDYEKIAENNSYELYLNKTSLGVQIKDIDTGNIYRTALEESEGLNKTWSNFMYSGVTIECLNEKQKVVRRPLTLADTEISLHIIENGFMADILFVEESIALTLKVTLEEDKLIVEIPEESIVETGKIKLQNIYLYPFLGASYQTNNNGYFFVPDGSGALIRTNQEVPLVTAPYSKQFYGSDLGIGEFAIGEQNSMLYEPKQINIPVYGIISNPNEQGIAVIIDDGDEYAQLEAYVSGISTPYNFITTKFMYRENYSQAMSQGGTPSLVNQEKANQTGIRINYTFLSGDDATYVGVAKTYRSKLIEEGVLKSLELDTKIPLKIEFLASEMEERLIGKSTKIMTTVEDMNTIIGELIDNGVEDLTTVIRGFGKEGATSAAPSKINLNKKLGSHNEWSKFLQNNKNLGVETELFVDVAKAYLDNDGYNKGRDIAQAINKNLLGGYWYGKYYYTNVEFIEKQLNILSKESNGIDVSGLAIETSGHELYSNWSKKNRTSRSESKEILSNIDLGDTKVSYYQPNSYMWKNTDKIYDIPMENSQYLIFTDSVPFLQILLKGYIPYFGEALNFNADTTNQLLKMVEYGAYPSYYLTMEDSIELFDTASAWLYTSQYEIWKEQILNEYEYINMALSKVRGSNIVSRTVLSENVVCIGYSNDVSIYVNYTNSDFTTGNVTVKAKSFIVIEQEDR